MQEPIRRRSDGQTMVCARCDVPIQLNFSVPFKEIAHMTHENEYSTLEDFPVVLYCPECGSRTASTGRNLTIDTNQMVIVHCEIVPISGDLTPPDEIPDDLA